MSERRVRAIAGEGEGVDRAIDDIALTFSPVSVSGFCSGLVGAVVAGLAFGTGLAFFSA